MIYVGVDYSIHSPAICILKNNTIHFISLAREGVASLEFYRKLFQFGIRVEATSKLLGSKKMLLNSRESTLDSLFLASNAISIIKEIAGKESDPTENVFVIEGFSYNSVGNRLAQISGYQFVFRNMLILSGLIDPDYINQNLWVFAPQTVKAQALVGRDDRNTIGKLPMIKAFREESLKTNQLKGLNKTPFWQEIKNHPSTFQDKKGNYLKPIDDIIDSYFVLKTYFNVINDFNLLQKYTENTERIKKNKESKNPAISKRFQKKKKRRKKVNTNIVN